eukprot:Anaeramoba_ignava/c21779_g1_i1.p1 GENE.c21779_g1_i1~~c21779_g1_i1.p1  ORF type:complete len:1921 (+),score=481.66 c21779_g1_i1:1462-7224(+)
MVMLYSFIRSHKPQFFMVSHSSIILKSLSINPPINMCNITLLHSSLASHQSLIELWGTIINAGRIIISESTNVFSPNFASLAQRHSIKVVFLSSYLFQQIVDNHVNNPYLREKRKDRNAKSLKDSDDAHSENNFPFSILELLVLYGEPIEYNLMDKFFKLNLLPEKIVFTFALTEVSSICTNLVIWDRKTLFQTKQKIAHSQSDESMQAEKENGPTDEIVQQTNLVNNANIRYYINEYKTSTNYFPLGTPSNDCRIYVLNKKLELAPIGSVGSIFISSRTLSAPVPIVEKKKESQTQSPKQVQPQRQLPKSFVPNPFQDVDSGKFLINTEVKGSIVSSGNLEFMEYSDPREIKLTYSNGDLVSISVIESVLKKNYKISQVSVVARDLHLYNRKRLIAYVVPNTKKPITVDELRRSVQEHLPSQNVPDIFVVVDETDSSKTDSNGVLDRMKIIRHYEMMNSEKKRKIRDRFSRTKSEEITKYPRNPTEEFLCQVFASVLDYEQVGIDDNFFSLGGNEIAANRIALKCIDAGFQVSVEKIIKFPVICDLSEYIIETMNFFQTNLALSANQKWFSQQKFGNVNQSSRAIFVRFNSSTNIETLRKAYFMILKQHEIFSIKFPNLKPAISPISQENKKKIKQMFTITRFDHKSTSPSEIVKQCLQIQQTLDIAKGPLVKFVIFVDQSLENSDDVVKDKNDAQFILSSDNTDTLDDIQDSDEDTKPQNHMFSMFLFHNLIIDTNSIRTFLENLHQNYTNISTMKKKIYRNLQPSFSSYYEWINEETNLEISTNAYEFWKKTAQKKPNYVKPLPKDFSTPIDNLYEYSSNIKVSFDYEKSHLLYVKTAQKNQYEFTDILMTAVALALHDWTTSIYNFIHLIEFPKNVPEKFRKLVCPKENRIPVLIGFTQPNVTADLVKSLALVKQQLTEFRENIHQYKRLMYYNTLNLPNVAETFEDLIQYDTVVNPKEKQTPLRRQSSVKDQIKRTESKSKDTEILKSPLGFEVPDHDIHPIELESDSLSDDGKEGRERSQSNRHGNADDDTISQEISSDEDDSRLKMPDNYQTELQTLEESEIGFTFLGDLEFKSFPLGSVSIDKVTDLKRIRKLNNEKSAMPYSVEIISYIQDECIYLKIVYNKKMYKPDTIKNFSRKVMKILLKLSKKLGETIPTLPPQENTNENKENVPKGRLTVDFPLAKNLTNASIQELFDENNSIENIVTPLQLHQEMLRFFLRKDQIVKRHLCQQLMLPFFTTKIDTQLFQKACSTFINNCTFLKSYFIRNPTKQSNILQVVQNQVEIPFKFSSFAKESEPMKELSISKLLSAEQQKQFKFSHPPLFSITLTKVAAHGSINEYLLTFSFEPFMLDSRSIPLFIRGIFYQYLSYYYSFNAFDPNPENENSQPQIPKDAPKNLDSSLKMHSKSSFLNFLKAEQAIPITTVKKFFQSMLHGIDFSFPMIQSRSSEQENSIEKPQENEQTQKDDFIILDQKQDSQKLGVCTQILDRILNTPSTLLEKKNTTDVDVNGQILFDNVKFKELNHVITSLEYHTINETLRSNSINLNAFLHFAWAFTLYSVTHKSTLYFGTEATGRIPEAGQGNELTVGMFSKILPFKIVLQKDIKLFSLLQHIQLNLVRINEYHKATTTKIRRWMELGRKYNLFSGGVIIYDSMHSPEEICRLKDLGNDSYNLQLDFSENFPKAKIAFSNIKIRRAFQFPLSLIIDPSCDELMVRIVYDEDKFPKSLVAKLFNNYIKIITTIGLKHKNFFNEINYFIEELIVKDINKDLYANEKPKKRRVKNKANLAQFNPDHVFKMGFLTQQRIAPSKSKWKKRWFVLKNDNRLYYFKTRNSPHLCGVIQLTNASIEPLSDSKKKNCFQIKDDQQTHLISAESSDLMRDWIKEIKNILTRQDNDEDDEDYDDDDYQEFEEFSD